MLSALTVLAVVALRRAGPGADRFRNRLWLFVPMFILWANCHLCWFYGLAVLWITVVGEWLDQRRDRPALPRLALRTMTQVSVVSSFAVMVSAVGPRAYVLIVTGGRLGKKLQISEYRPPSLHTWFHVPFFLLLVLTVVALLVRWRQASLADIGLVAVTGALALTTVRVVPLFATVAAPVASRYLSDIVAARAGRRRAGTDGDVEPEEVGFAAMSLTIAMVAVVGAAVVTTQLSAANVDRSLDARYPVAAVAWIREHHPPGTLFNDYNWGGYLIWELPSYPVSLDGRAEIHVGLMEEMAKGRAAEALLREGVHLVLTQTGGGLARGMSADPDWKISYQDRVATVLTPVHPL
jgi:hypothetical protein